MDKLITMDDTEYKRLIADKEAAQDYIKRLEDALLIFGIDPKNTIIDFRDVATFYAKGRRDEQAMLDAAQARAKELEAKLDTLKRERHDESVRSGERIQDLTRRCADLTAERDAWHKDHEALRVKMIDLEAAVKQATAQISAQAAELDQVYTDRDTLKQHVLIAEGRIKALEDDLLKASRPEFPESMSAILIAELEALRADVAAVWELWGAGRERQPGKLHEICQEQERLSAALESQLRVIAEKLDAAKVPSHYGRDQKGGPVPLPERVDLLIASRDDARRRADHWESSAMLEAEERMDASTVLDELGAPDHAGSIHLNTAARIRAIPGLLRP